MQYFIPCLLLIFFIPFGTCANQRITLLTDDQHDPLNLKSQTLHSIGTDSTRLVLNGLKQWQVNLQHVPATRLNKLLSTSPATCAYNRIKTPERIKKLVFSLPLNIFLSHRLYYLPERGDLPQSLLQKGSLLSLDVLFTRYPKRLLGTAKGRSYGKQLDAQIAGLEQKNLISITNPSAYYDMSKMLVRGRTDDILEYPATIKEILQDLPLKSYPISGTPKYIVGYFACYPDRAGKAFIQHVDQVLLALHQSSELYLAHTYHLNPADIPTFEQYYFQVLRESITKSN